jgi:hypothetical protein
VARVRPTDFESKRDGRATRTIRGWRVEAESWIVAEVEHRSVPRRNGEGRRRRLVAQRRLQVTEGARQSPEALWRNYAKCLDGGEAELQRLRWQS